MEGRRWRRVWPCPEDNSFTCILLILWQSRFHEIPLLRVANKNIHLGLEPTWIVQTGSGQPDDAPLRIFRAGQARAAFGTEAAQVVAAVQARSGVMLQRAFGYPERLERRDNDGSVRPAAHLLAVTTMAFKHHQWSGAAFVADFTADATAGKGEFHQR